MPERARQRRREAARKRNRRILAGAGVLTLLGVAASRFGGSKGKADQGQPWQAEPSGGWAGRVRLRRRPGPVGRGDPAPRQRRRRRRPDAAQLT